MKISVYKAYKLISALLLYLFLFSGCSQKAAEPAETLPGPEETVPVIASGYDNGFNFFREEDYELSLYEPENGCILGAYIQSSLSAKNDNEVFEASVNKEHGLYTYFMKMGQPFPVDWVLECMAEKKTPNIVLMPENIDEPFSTLSLERMAKKIGEFYIPVFVHIYPVKAEYAYEVEAYKNFYKISSAVFKRYASNAALVWDIDLESAVSALEYYPGDDYVDWVGLNIYENMESEQIDISENADFNHFYYTFQEKKPIFISELGISHFTEEGYTYNVKEAGENLGLFYDNIKNRFPRVKAVNYMDFNGLNPVNMKKGKDNYSVTDHEDMTKAYAKAVEDKYFLSEVDFSSGSENVKQLIKEPFTLNYYEGNYYLPEIALNKSKAYNTEKNPIKFSEGAFYKLLEDSGNYRIESDFNRRIAVIKR